MYEESALPSNSFLTPLWHTSEHHIRYYFIIIAKKLAEGKSEEEKISKDLTEFL
jgi:hypothetical protein